MRPPRIDTSLDLFDYIPEYFGEDRDESEFRKIRQRHCEMRIREFEIQEHERKAYVAELAKTRTNGEPHRECGISGVRFQTPVKLLRIPPPTNHPGQYRRRY